MTEVQRTAPSWEDILAPKINTAAVNLSEDLTPDIRDQHGNTLSGFKEYEAARALRHSRSYNRSLCEIDFSDIAELTCDTKEDLTLETLNILLRDTSARYEDRATIKKAGLLGVSDSLALMSLVARVQSRLGNDTFDNQVYESAVRGSLSVILLMTRLSGDADVALVKSMMQWTDEEYTNLTLEDLCCGLEFDENFFDIKKDGSVALKDLEEIHPEIKNRNDELDITEEQRKVLFGCPFRGQAAKLYGSLTKAMIKNGIAEKIFLTNREECSSYVNTNTSIGHYALHSNISLRNE